MSKIKRKAAKPQSIKKVKKLLPPGRGRARHLLEREVLRQPHAMSGVQACTPSTPPRAARKAVTSFQRNEIVCFFMMFVIKIVV